MKNKIITMKLDNVTIHEDTDYTYPREKGAVDIPADKIGEVPENVALILVLLSGARRYYITRATYYALREGVWHHLDRAGGGITAAAQELFEDGEAVLIAAKISREAHSRKTTNTEAKK